MERCTERAVCPVSKGETPCAGYSWRQVSHPWRSPASLQRSPAAAAAEAIPTAAAAEIRTPAAAAVEAPLHLPVEAVTVTADNEVRVDRQQDRVQSSSPAVGGVQPLGAQQDDHRGLPPAVGVGVGFGVE